jgi:hypothetical protein
MNHIPILTSFYLEGEGDAFFPNVGNHVQECAGSQPEEQISIVSSEVFSRDQPCEN